MADHAAARSVELRVIEWDARATEDLAPLAEAAPGGVAAHEAQISAGGGQVWAVVVDGARCGTITTRRDRHADGSVDFVVEYARAHAAGMDLTAACMPALEGVAAGLGCARFRIHTQRRGLVRKLAKRGFGVPEFVCVKELMT